MEALKYVPKKEILASLPETRSTLPIVEARINNTTIKERRLVGLDENHLHFFATALSY